MFCYNIKKSTRNLGRFHRESGFPASQVSETLPNSPEPTSVCGGNTWRRWKQRLLLVPLHSASDSPFLPVHTPGDLGHLWVCEGGL